MIRAQIAGVPREAHGGITMKKLVLIFSLMLAFGPGTALLAPAPLQNVAHAAEKKQQTRTYEWCQEQIRATGGGQRGGPAQQARIKKCMSGASTY